MEILKKTLSVILIALLAGCDKVTLTEILKLETDTYIDSSEMVNHANLAFLNLSKSAEKEERIIIKFPSGKRDNRSHLDDALKNPFSFPLLPFIIFIEILEAILDCRNTVLRPENLTNAKLVLDFIDNQEGALAGKLGLFLLAKPWWQNATWESGHYFSSKGRWASPGGDTDTSFSRIDNTVNATSVEWDITQYFKSLITTVNSVHFGMLIRANNASLKGVSLVSTQHDFSNQRPRIVATYTGSCVKSDSQPGEPRTFYLGSDPTP